MALPHYITPSELKWLFESTIATSKNPFRDACLIAFFIGTPCFILEINRIQICDILEKNGKLKKSFMVRGDTAFNGDVRECFIRNENIRRLIRSYLVYLIENNKCVGDHPDYFLGLNPDSPLFDFAITSKQVGDKKTYAAASLGRHMKKLLSDGGIEEPNVLSGRRVFANVLHQKGIDISYINHLLGNKTLETTRKLLITNTIDMGAIAAQAF